MNSDLKILLLIFGVLALPLVFADDLTTTITITSANPELGAITCDLRNETTPDNTIDLYAGNVVVVDCELTADDDNGYDDMTFANGTLCIGTNVTSDVDNCYLNSSCGLGSQLNATARQINCSYVIVYYAEPLTAWNATINVNDTDSAQWGATISNTEITISALNALDVINTTLAFSSQALGTNTSFANSKSTFINNTGNTRLDATFQETSGPGYLSCSLGGNIAVNTSTNDSGIYFNKSNEVDFRVLNTTKITETATQFNLLDLNKTTSSGETPEELWYRVRTPFSGAAGTCTGTIRILAASDA